MLILTYKITFFLSCILAAVSIGSVAGDKCRGRIGKWFTRQRIPLTESSDLAGLSLSSAHINLLAPFAPVARLILKLIRRKRLKAADAGLPAALVFFMNGLKAGLAFPQVIEMAAAELGSPLGPEFKRVSELMKEGQTVEEALEVFSRRLPTEDIQLFVQSIEILRRTGGNLVETMGILIDMIDGRNRVQKKIGTATTQGRFQAYMLLAMPWMLGIVLYSVAPDYMEPLLTGRLGTLIIIAGTFLEITGALWMWRIVDIRV